MEFMSNLSTKESQDVPRTAAESNVVAANFCDNNIVILADDDNKMLISNLV